MRHARRGVAPVPARRRRRRRVRRDAQTSLHHGTAARSPRRASQADRLPGLGLGGDGPRRRAGPQPQVALIDELAHTNVPGSGRHEKRWEDVLEILEAGIAVITTVNIQHLESLADPVERMTGVERARTGARLGGPQGGSDRAHRLVGRSAPSPHAARQHLSEREGAVGPQRLLPRREPRRAARAVAPLRCRRDRGGDPRVPALTGCGGGAVGDDGTDHGRRHRCPWKRIGHPASRAHRRPAEGAAGRDARGER